MLSVIAAGIGAGLRTSTGYSAPLLEGLLGLDALSLNIGEALIAIAAVTLIAWAGHLIIYYVVARPRVPEKDMAKAEDLRFRMGLLARVLHGGAVEEVQFRWGLMSLLALLAGLALGEATAEANWAAVFGAALVYGLYQMSGSRQMGMGRGVGEFSLNVLDNLWVGVAFGWLFWQYGLYAAILSHGLMHALWYPVERAVAQRELAPKRK